MYLGTKLLACLPISADSDKSVRVPLSNKISENRISVCVKSNDIEPVDDLEVDEEGSIGSVSFPQQVIAAGGLNTYLMWVTLFEHRDDDEYDGQMGLQDNEEPRVQIQFVTQKDTDDFTRAKTYKNPNALTTQAKPKQQANTLPTTMTKSPSVSKAVAILLSNKQNSSSGSLKPTRPSTSGQKPNSSAMGLSERSLNMSQRSAEKSFAEQPSQASIHKSVTSL